MQVLLAVQSPLSINKNTFSFNLVQKWCLVTQGRGMRFKGHMRSILSHPVPSAAHRHPASPTRRVPRSLGSAEFTRQPSVSQSWAALSRPQEPRSGVDPGYRQGMGM